MRLKLKDFNYQKFFFDYGEKIGLAAAGLTALALGVWLIPALFIPSASTRAEGLKKITDGVTNNANGNRPAPYNAANPAQDPGESPPTDVEKRLVAFTFDVIPNASIEQDYRVNGLFDGRRGGPAGRQMPIVLAPEESNLALVHFQLPSMIYSVDKNDQQWVWLLKGVPTTTGSGGMNPNPGGTAGGATGPKMGNPNGGFNPGGNLQGSRNGKKYGLLRPKDQTDSEKAEHDFDVIFKKVEDYNASTDTRAMQPLPVRGVEIVAGFPYKAQLQEFMDRLGYSSLQAVLDSKETYKDDKGQEVTGPTFRFLAVEVERRQVDGQGRPLDAQGAVLATPDGGWSEPLDMKKTYGDFVVWGGGVDKLQKETRFAKVALNGLTLPKLPTVGDYPLLPDDLRNLIHEDLPVIEDTLPKLKDTVDALANNPTKPIAKPPFTQSPDDPFNLNSGDAASPAGTGGPMPMPMGGMGPKPLGPPPGGTGPVGNPNGGAPASPMGGDSSQGVIPDYVLIRVFDFTQDVEPGKTYQYRLRIHMANPNYQRKDVASQGVSQNKELVDKEWYVLPHLLTVPSDVNIYALDQAKLDAKDKDKDPKDPNAPKLPKLPLQPFKDANMQTVLQIQKWVDILPTKNRTDLKIGDWVIAERVLATRGEPIPGQQRVEAPYWRYQQNRFMMATDQPPPKPADEKKFVATVEVPFIPEGKEPILVDFRGGDVTYARTHPKTDDGTAPTAEPPISDKAPEEVLLYTADGRLVAHDAAKDAADPDRIKRLKDIRDWIEAVKKLKGGKEENKGPFGTPGPPGM